MDSDWLAQRFEENRDHLRAVAYRMLGSPVEADDAVQETWLRLNRADTSDVQNLGGWLTTVVARVCLDMLRSRDSRREQPFTDYVPEPIESRDAGHDPEHEVLLADAIAPALLIVLETLGPAERVAFVLHDVFAVPFDDIATIVGRTSEATRQLASRARRRVQGAANDGGRALPRQWRVVEAFLAATREGNFEGLLRLLDPEVELRLDAAAVAMGSRVGAARGARDVAESFVAQAGGAKAVQPALLNGSAGLVFAMGGQVRVAFVMTVAGDHITNIELVADSDRLAAMDIAILGRNLRRFRDALGQQP